MSTANWSTKALVDRGLELRDRIKTLQTELKEIEAALQERGLNGNQIELKDEDRDGRRYLAKGSKMVVPVVFTADRIVGSFVDGSKVHALVAKASGTPDNLRQFFALVKTWENGFKDGKAFRGHAAELFGAKAAPAFIDACLARDKNGIPKSDVKIEWGQAEALEDS